MKKTIKEIKDFNENILKVCDFLVKNDIERSYLKITQKTGVNINYIRDLRSGKSCYSEKFLEKLCLVYNINKNFVLTGEGEMLNEAKTSNTTSDKNKVPFQENNVRKESNNVRKEFTETPFYFDDLQPTENVVFVPLYNLDVRAGMHGANDVVDETEYIERQIVFDGARQGDVAFNVFGDSMQPRYLPGSIVLCREVERWQEYFGYGNCFVIFLSDGRRILKIISKSEQDSHNNVLCVSVNPKYVSEELPKSMIVKVFKVIGSLNKESF